jgi:hypothetical protein
MTHIHTQNYVHPQEDEEHFTPQFLICRCIEIIHHCFTSSNGYKKIKNHQNSVQILAIFALLCILRSSNEMGEKKTFLLLFDSVLLTNKNETKKKRKRVDSFNRRVHVFHSFCYSSSLILFTAKRKKNSREKEQAEKSLMIHFHSYSYSVQLHTIIFF